VFDDNRITIDGPTSLSTSDDVAARFGAYGWDVQYLGEIGDDVDALEGALLAAKAVEDRPSLMILRTHIGTPSPDHTDDHEAHGLAFSADDVSRTKAVMGIPDEPFWAPAELVEAYRTHTGTNGREARDGWRERAADVVDTPDWKAAWAGGGVPGWDADLPTFEIGSSKATRQAIQAVLDAARPGLPGLVSGAADLTGNTGTKLDDAPMGRHNPGGRQVHYGIREHGMAAAMTGMSLHGGVIPVGGTFFVFSDYMRPSVRLAAVSEAKVIYSWTHDSVGLGEDGPTHQPIEHLASLRAMPGLRIVRPADANETAQAWKIAIDNFGPTGLVLSRQDVPVLEGTAGAPVEKGAYVLVDADDPDVVLIGTGSEVAVCVGAAAQLAESGVVARVVSMPSWGLFEEQSDDYQASVLPPAVPTLAVEAGTAFGWDRWADDSVSIDRFGASAPGSEALAKLGYTPDNVAERARQLIDDLREDSA
jgi:transketolase